MFGQLYNLVWFFFVVDLLVGFNELGKMTSEKKIGIVGSGLIGKSWAMIFASKGYPVSSEIVKESFPLIIKCEWAPHSNIKKNEVFIFET